MSEVSHACACITPITVRVVLNNASNSRMMQLKEVSVEVENLQESAVPDLRLLYRKIERKMLIKRVLGAVPGSSILNKFRQSSIRKEHVCFKYFIEISAKMERKRKSVVLKNRRKMFRDNNHQSLYKKMKLYNDIECRESGTSIHE